MSQNVTETAELGAILKDSLLNLNLEIPYFWALF